MRHLRPEVRAARLARKLRDELVHKTEAAAGVNVRDCCKDARNLVPVQNMDDILAGRIVSVCRRCKRRNVRMRVEPWEMGFSWRQTISVPSRDVARRLGL